MICYRDINLSVKICQNEPVQGMCQAQCLAGMSEKSPCSAAPGVGEGVDVTPPAQALACSSYGPLQVGMGIGGRCDTSCSGGGVLYAQAYVPHAQSRASLSWPASSYEPPQGEGWGGGGGGGEGET